MTANYTLCPHACRPFRAGCQQGTPRSEKASFPHSFWELSTFSRVYFEFLKKKNLSHPLKLLHATGCINQRAGTHTPPPLFPLLSPPACSQFQFSPAPCLLSLPAEMLGTCDSGTKATVFLSAILNRSLHTNLIFFPISCLLLCQHSLIVPSAGSFCHVCSVCVCRLSCIDC